MEPQVRYAIGNANTRGMLAGMAHQRTSNALTALASGAAFVVSCVSLWETSLKQPDLQFYLGQNLSLTRDPWVSDEVLVVPITITNGGARDGAVLSMQLDVRNVTTGTTDRFQSSYTVDASYFGATDDITQFRHRPKVPFSPVVVSGRTTYSGTILFYPVKSHEKYSIGPKSSIELVASLETAKPADWVDKMLAGKPESVSVKLDVPDFLPGALLAGDLARLHPPEARAAP